jgi:hypothetical protein
VKGRSERSEDSAKRKGEIDRSKSARSAGNTDPVQPKFHPRIPPEEDLSDYILKPLPRRKRRQILLQ